MNFTSQRVQLYRVFKLLLSRITGRVHPLRPGSSWGGLRGGFLEKVVLTLIHMMAEWRQNILSWEGHMWSPRDDRMWHTQHRLLRERRMRTNIDKQPKVWQGVLMNETFILKGKEACAFEWVEKQGRQRLLEMGERGKREKEGRWRKRKTIQIRSGFK